MNLKKVDKNDCDEKAIESFRQLINTLNRLGLDCKDDTRMYGFATWGDMMIQLKAIYYKSLCNK